MSSQERGFTLIELLISIAILALFSAVIILGYSTLSRGSELKAAAFKVLDILNLAHARTLASLATSSYGVHFEQTQFVLFKGTVYNAADTNNIFYPLSSTLEIANISLAGGGQNVVFDRLTGKTSQSGSLMVRFIADPTRLKTITVLSSGRADIIETALIPTGTRIADTRHEHFTYGASIASVVNLVLYFPNDAMALQVPFQTYYSGGVFDWSGTVTVAGVPQILRVHTHATSGSSADFSVTRDMRYNNKVLQISLDGENVINYAANGAVTQGSSLWASAPQAQ